MKLFDSVSMKRPPQNKFNLSHERKGSFNMGALMPMLVQEILPGDSFRVNTEIMLRMAPMLAPIMHRVDVRTEYFFVPNRLVWDEWEDFITGGRLGTSAPVAPRMNMNVNIATGGFYRTGTLWDYMGLPTFEGSVTNNVQVSALPFRAYQLIYNEYYRDQNLSEPIAFSKASGISTELDMVELLSTRTRAWEKDYFTSALPFAQRGPAVLMPIEGTGSVTYKGTSDVFDLDGVPGTVNTLIGTGNTLGSLGVNKTGTGVNGTYGRIENIDEVIFDSTSITINDLRRSVKLQEWLEKNATGGARYTEQLRAHFGVVSDDARLQRPEYLGGGKAPMVVSEVLSTFQAADGEGNPQANMAGHGISVGGKNGFARRFKEHGHVIAICSVLPRTAYQQGIDRKFRRFDKFDYFWPEFAHIGEQEVKVGEIYYDAIGSATQDDTFGYQSRYAEYKYAPTTVHGKLRTNLAFWHMGRIFDGEPALNPEFVEADPTTRIFAVGDDDPDVEHLYFQIYHKIDALRPMPYYGTPQL